MADRNRSPARVKGWGALKSAASTGKLKQLKAAEEAEREAKRLEAERIEKEKLDVALAWASKYDVAQDLRQLAATYNDDEQESLSKVLDWREERQEYLEIVTAAFDREAKKFRQKTVVAVPQFLDTAESADPLRQASQDAIATTRAVKSYVTIALKLLRLRTRRANLKQMISTLENIDAIEVHTRSVIEKISHYCFSEAVQRLGLLGSGGDAGDWSLGDPMTADEQYLLPIVSNRTVKALAFGEVSETEESTFGIEAAASASFDGHDAHLDSSHKQRPDQGNLTKSATAPAFQTSTTKKKNDITRANLGASAARRWRCLSDPMNPFLSMALQKALLHSVASKRVLGRFDQWEEIGPAPAQAVSTPRNESQQADDVEQSKKAVDGLGDAQRTPAALGTGKTVAPGSRPRGESMTCGQYDPMPFDTGRPTDMLDPSDDSSIDSALLRFDEDDAEGGAIAHDNDGNSPAKAITDVLQLTGNSSPEVIAAVKRVRGSSMGPGAVLGINSSFVGGTFVESASVARILLFGVEDLKLLRAELVREVIAFESVSSGLASLGIPLERASSFFSATVSRSIPLLVRAVMRDTLGETFLNWEDGVDSLLPSEFQRCTRHVLRLLLDLLRQNSLVQQQVLRRIQLEKQHSVNLRLSSPTSKGKASTKSHLPVGFDVMSLILTQCIHITAAYGKQLPQRGGIDDLLQVFHLLFLFLDACDAVFNGYLEFERREKVGSCGFGSPDRRNSVDRSTLQLVLQQRLDQLFVEAVAGPTINTLMSESWMPFPVKIDDFPPVKPLARRPEFALSTVISEHQVAVAACSNDDEDDDEERKEKEAKPAELTPAEGDTLTPKKVETSAAASSTWPEGDRALGKACLATFKRMVPNIFFHHTLSAGSTPPCIDASDGSSIFEHLPVFTFTSFMVCRKMTDLVSSARHCPDAADAIMQLLGALASQYVWFVLVHFVANDSERPAALADDPNLPPIHRSAVLLLQEAAKFRAPPSYPALPNSMIVHQWKSSVNQSSQLFAAKERSTALCSIEPILLSLKLCAGALSQLLSPDGLAEHLAFLEQATGLANFCVGYGFRKLSTSLLPSESISGFIEKQKWDISSGGENCIVKQVKDLVFALDDKLKDAQQKEMCTAVAIQRILLYCVYNISVGFVDGVSKVRRWSEKGRQLALAEATSTAKLVRNVFPQTPPRMTEYVLRYTTIMASNAGDGIREFFMEWHALYTTKQLLALTERESLTFAKKTDLHTLLTQLKHEDRPPYVLLDG